MSTAMQKGADAARDKSRPDILFVITDFQVGGSERQLALLASALAEGGMTVAVFGFMDGPVRAALQDAGVEAILASGAKVSHRRNFLGLPLAMIQLFWLMLRRRPHIVHFFLPQAYLLGAPLAVLAGVPVRIMSRRSLNTYQRRRVVSVAERCYHRFMHAVIGNSRSVVEQLKAEGVSQGQAGLIYNGFDERQFSSAGTREENRVRLGLSPATLAMSIVANLIPYKGHHDLIDALALAAPRLPTQWRLLVVGRDDGVGSELRKQVHSLGLEKSVMFLGPRDDIPAILGASDIGIVSSHEEGFSNVILEGMAAELAMVVTRVGGNAEAVIDGETGLVVPARDVRALSEAILRLADDQNLRAKYGHAGRKRVTEHFSLGRFVECHRKLYQALAAGSRPFDLPEIRV
jgi:glycosyltransferase involved in cell wall biosynthesis